MDLVFNRRRHMPFFMSQATHVEDDKYFSILRADDETAATALLGYTYEVMDPDGEIHRFPTLEKVEDFIKNWSSDD